MTKKILLIIGILAILGIAAFLIFSSTPQIGDDESRIGFSIRDYLPFGKSGNLDTGEVVITRNEPTGTTTPGTNTGPINQPVPRLRKISSEPVAGAVIFNTATTSLVRFVEKGTGNVYEAKSNSVSIQRLTNTTIPKIIRAFWLPNGSGFLAQTLMEDSEIIETAFVKLNKNTATSTSEVLTPFTTTQSKLPTGIKEISIKPDGTKVFYYTALSSSNWFISNPDGTGVSLVFSHPLAEWIPRWTSANTITMQTKGNYGIPKLNYSFDIANKILRKTGSNVSGISPIGNTLAEKCVELKDGDNLLYCGVPERLPSGNFPDVWYKGLVSTEDSIKKIDAENDIFYNISNLSSESGQKIDVVDINLSPDETHLIFRNKIDGFLWMLRIEE